MKNLSTATAWLFLALKVATSSAETYSNETTQLPIVNLPHVSYASERCTAL